MTVETKVEPRHAASGVYRLDQLTPEEVTHWDALIAPFEGRQLFHRTPWLDYLAESREIHIVQWAIRSDGLTLGYLCGGIVRMGPFKILGSPLRSWGTNSMGPLMGHDVDQLCLLRSLDELARADRIAMIELEHPALSPAVLRAGGFERVPDWTYLVPLVPAEPDVMWRALDSTCRNRVRKAMSAGLTVEDTDDPGAVDEYYDFYLALMARKARTPPFPAETPRLLFRHLKKADSLFALRVRDPQGRVLAVGLFPHDDCTMYFWSGASRKDSHPLCPNDLLHWTAMRLAASRGLRLYNMSGYGRFKRKFGGVLTEVARWHKSYWRTARWARRGYQAWFEALGTRKFWTLGSARHNGASERAHRGAMSAAGREAPFEIVTRSQRPSFRLSDISKAPLHDFPIRDEILYQYLPLSRDMDLLEIGPGSGVTAFRLARQVRSITLLDIAPGNVSSLRQSLGHARNLRFVCGDVCEPGLAQRLGRAFDAAYAIEVFELLPDPRTCLRNLAEVTRPGGHVLLQFPNYPPDLSPGPTHFRTRRELGGLLEEAGFTAWNVAAIRLRPYANLIYSYAHERPIRAYRHRRRGRNTERPLVYDESWAFQHGQRLEPFKYALHVAWTMLSGVMRLGGPAFAHAPLDDDILNRNLIVVARR